jgi:IS5 family transposase
MHSIAKKACTYINFWGDQMYRKRQKNQITMFQEPLDFSGVTLNPNNRWIKMSELIPWDIFEEKYSKNFEKAKTGKPAKPARMALGAHIIKERLKLSDEETLEVILESPYLQYFIGLNQFTHKEPFDSSTMCWFRKRLSPEMLSEVNDYIIGRKVAKDKKDDDQGDRPGGSDSGNPDGENIQPKKPENKGTIILDATCAPADISFPTDVALLNEGREKLEEIIDTMHEAGITKDRKKPRTYREKARKQYLRFARNRKPKKRDIRRAVKGQLGYVRRDLMHIDKLLAMGGENHLTEKQKEYLKSIKTLYKQQKQMYDTKSHTVENRIVSIHQPWVRPIVRGKASAAVEFGAKISISMLNGYAKIERLDWDAYNESTTLIETIERYFEQTGCYPERVLADKIYRTRENLRYCENKGIRMNGPKLGRPTKDKTIYRQQCKLEQLEAGERNAVEGKFGEGKRFYNLMRIKMRLKETSEVGIHLVFLVMNLQKRLRAFLRLFWEAIYWGYFKPLITV